MTETEGLAVVGNEGEISSLMDRLGKPEDIARVALFLGFQSFGLAEQPNAHRHRPKHFWPSSQLDPQWSKDHAPTRAL
jgi:hypothetical protein